jgi:hypothetical protein
VVELWLAVPAAIPMLWVGALLIRGNPSLFPSQRPDSWPHHTSHLTVFLLSHEHMSEVLRGERVVTTPPRHSPLAPWLCSGNPEDFDGPILMSWVFFRHMSLRDEHGGFTYTLHAKVLRAGGVRGHCAIHDADVIGMA